MPGGDQRVVVDFDAVVGVVTINGEVVVVVLVVVVVGGGVVRIPVEPMELL